MFGKWKYIFFHKKKKKIRKVLEIGVFWKKIRHDGCMYGNFSNCYMFTSWCIFGIHERSNICITSDYFHWKQNRGKMLKTYLYLKFIHIPQNCYLIQLLGTICFRKVQFNTIILLCTYSSYAQGEIKNLHQKQTS